MHANYESYHQPSTTELLTEMSLRDKQAQIAAGIGHILKLAVNFDDVKVGRFKNREPRLQSRAVLLRAPDVLDNQKLKLWVERRYVHWSAREDLVSQIVNLDGNTITEASRAQSRVQTYADGHRSTAVIYNDALLLPHEKITVLDDVLDVLSCLESEYDDSRYIGRHECGIS